MKSEPGLGSEPKAGATVLNSEVELIRVVRVPDEAQYILQDRHHGMGAAGAGRSARVGKPSRRSQSKLLVVFSSLSKRWRRVLTKRSGSNTLQLEEPMMIMEEHRDHPPASPLSDPLLTARPTSPAGLVSSTMFSDNHHLLLFDNRVLNDSLILNNDYGLIDDSYLLYDSVLNDATSLASSLSYCSSVLSLSLSNSARNSFSSGLSFCCRGLDTIYPAHSNSTQTIPLSSKSSLSL